MSKLARQFSEKEIEDARSFWQERDYWQGGNSWGDILIAMVEYRRAGIATWMREPAVAKDQPEQIESPTSEITAELIEELLNGYQCRHTVDGDTEDGLPLVDMLAPPAADISVGQLEVEALAEYLYDNLPDPEPLRAFIASLEADRDRYRYRT